MGIQKESLINDYLTSSRFNPLFDEFKTRYNYFIETVFSELVAFNSELTPLDYFAFAKSDFESSSKKGFINALGNIKKAIHLSIDNLLKISNLFDILKDYNFPQKLDFFFNIGAFPIKIVQEINKVRNAVEHDYKAVDSKSIENYLDITELFLRVVFPMLSKNCIGAHVGIKNEKRCLIYEISFDGDPAIVVYSAKEFKTIKIENIVYCYNFENDPKKFDIIATYPIDKHNIHNYIEYYKIMMFCTKYRMIDIGKQIHNTKEDSYIHFSRISSTFIDLKY